MRMGRFFEYIPEEGAYTRKATTKRYIRHDLYGIVERLKEMDPGYFVMYNTLNKKYEVHHRDNIGDTYCFATFPELDYRTLEITTRTMVHRSDDEYREMEEHNAKLERRMEADRRDLIGQITRESLTNPLLLGRQHFAMSGKV